MEQFIAQLPLLTPRDKRGVLNLVAKTIDLGVRRPSEFSSVAALSGVKIFRSVPRQSWLESRKRIYRVCGMGEIPGASAEVRRSNVGFAGCAMHVELKAHHNQLHTQHN